MRKFFSEEFGDEKIARLQEIHALNMSLESVNIMQHH